MSGRHAKPVELHLYDNKSRLTNDEIEARRQAEEDLKFGDHNFKIPGEISKDKAAKKKWKEMIKRYKDSGFKYVTTRDSETIARYCALHSLYQFQLNSLDEIKNKGMDAVKTYHIINDLGLINNILKTSAEMKTLEDRLIKNPLSSLKNVPLKVKQMIEDEKKKRMFGI